MSLYEICSSYADVDLIDEGTELSVQLIEEENPCTLPKYVEVSNELLFNLNMCEHVYYISDIHLEHRIKRKFKWRTWDRRIIEYVKKLARELINLHLQADIQNGYNPIIIFGGDVSSSLELGEVFYREFVLQWQATKRKYHKEYSPNYIYAILGNHELWEFQTLEECCQKYGEMFATVGIRFLQNSAEAFGRNRDLSLYEFEKPNHSPIIVGGIGFAAYNKKYNADYGMYRHTVNRVQEIEESRKWEEIYRRVVQLARETNNLLIVVTHNPLIDWKETPEFDYGCIYFSGHNHQNNIYHDEEKNIHVFSDNQVGYHSDSFTLKKAKIYNRMNPFVGYEDGYHEIVINDYLKFYDFMNEKISGYSKLQNQIDNGSKFYMIKNSGYYSFFLMSDTHAYICAGGKIKKIGKCTDISYFHNAFSEMIKKYLDKLSPYRGAQEKISAFVKSFGGSGKIHGCIVDIDFYNHIMLNPTDGKITYYYSPELGLIEPYDNVLALLENRNPMLAMQYRNKLNGTTDNSGEVATMNSASELVRIDIKNSVYVISNRVNQLQRLFDKKILREWNDELLYSEPKHMLCEDNNFDRSKRTPVKRQERKEDSSLSEEKKKEIVMKYLSCEATMEELTKEYGVKRSKVNKWIFELKDSLDFAGK